MGEVYVWNEMDAGNWEAPRGKGKFDIETGWAQKNVERNAPTYLSSPPLKYYNVCDLSATPRAFYFVIWFDFVWFARVLAIPQHVQVFGGNRNLTQKSRELVL